MGYIKETANNTWQKYRNELSKYKAGSLCLADTIHSKDEFITKMSDIWDQVISKKEKSEI